MYWSQRVIIEGGPVGH